MSTSCGAFFRAWQDKLKNEPDYWIVRSVESGTVWLNVVTQQLLQRESSVVDWISFARQLVGHEDLVRIEDKHSLVLKTSSYQTFDYRALVDREELRVHAVYAARRCAACARQCGVVIARLSFS